MFRRTLKILQHLLFWNAVHYRVKRNLIFVLMMDIPLKNNLRYFFWLKLLWKQIWSWKFLTFNIFITNSFLIKEFKNIWSVEHQNASFSKLPKTLPKSKYCLLQLYEKKRNQLWEKKSQLIGSGVGDHSGTII